MTTLATAGLSPEDIDQIDARLSAVERQAIASLVAVWRERASLGRGPSSVPLFRANHERVAVRLLALLQSEEPTPQQIESVADIVGGIEQGALSELQRKVCASLPTTFELDTALGKLAITLPPGADQATPEEREEIWSVGVAAFDDWRRNR